MKTTMLLIAVFGFAMTLSSAISIPLSRSTSESGVQTREDNKASGLSKRSTNADISLSGSRSTRMKDLMRQFILLKLLENVKGKRSGSDSTYPTKSDGTMDYDQITEILMGDNDPWYIADMKRDIKSSDEESDYGTDNVLPSELQDMDEAVGNFAYRERNHISRKRKMPSELEEIPASTRLGRLVHALLEKRRRTTSRANSDSEEITDDGMYDNNELLEFLGA